MASTKDLKTRITSVKTTQQTTRAMKLVSASKLRRAQEAISANRPYAKGLNSILKTLASMQSLNIESPLLKKAVEIAEEGKKNKALLVVITSDRGLCGGFNSNVIKNAQKWIKNSSASKDIQLAFVGKKGNEFFKNRGAENVFFYSEFGPKATFVSAKKTADTIVSAFAVGQFDEVFFVFNEFKNAISQVVQVEQVLPLSLNEIKSEGDVEVVSDLGSIVKPDATTVAEELLKKHFAIQVLRIFLESQASEHGSRMSAMENATKNAGDMIRRLSLQYNKQRQGLITKELLEIISGSESQKG